MNLINSIIKKIVHLYKSRLFFRFFTGYLFIVTLAALFFSLFYSHSYNAMLSKQTELNENSVLYAQYIIDNQINNILESTTLFQNMSGNGYIKEIEKINSQVGITTTLSNLKGHINIIDFCFVYNPALEYILTDSGSISKDIFFKDILKYKDGADQRNIIDALHSNKYLSILSSTQSYNNEDMQTDGMRRYITIIQGFDADYNQTKLVTMISEDKLFSLVPSISSRPYSSIVLLDKKNNILASSNGLSLTPDILGYVRKKSLPSGRFDSDNYLGYYMRSNRLDGTYLLVESKSVVLKELRHLRFVFVLMLFIITFLGVLSGYYFSWKNSSPIKKILQKLVPDRSYRYENKNALDRLSNAVLEIKQDNENYEFRQKLIRFFKSSEADLSLEKSFSYKMFSVLVLKTVVPTDMDEYLNLFIQKNTSLSVNYFPYGNKSYCLIVNSDTLTEENLFLFAIEIHDWLRDTYGLFSVIGIGEICDCFAKLTSSLTSAENAVKYGACSNTLYIYGSMEQPGNENIQLSDKLETTMLECMQIKNKTFAVNVLENIFANNKNLSNSSMKRLILLLINTFVKICKKSDLSYDITDTLGIIEDEYRTEYLKEYIINLYSFLFTAIPDYSLDQSEQIKKYIIGFVRKNYSDSSVTITLVAKKLGLSAPYISTVFKKSNGIGFSQYLSEYRIKIAKELLSSTNDKINDVAKKVGFGSYNSFSRVFHSLTGYTPRDYRYTFGREKH